MMAAAVEASREREISKRMSKPTMPFLQVAFLNAEEELENKLKINLSEQSEDVSFLTSFAATLKELYSNLEQTAAAFTEVLSQARAVKQKCDVRLKRMNLWCEMKEL